MYIKVLLELNKFLHVKRIATDVYAVIDYFYKFVNAWYATRLKLGPDQLSVKSDLKCSSRD